MTTEQAFTTSPNVTTFGYIFPSLYMVLFAVAYWVLRRHYKKPFVMQKYFSGVLPEAGNPTALDKRPDEQLPTSL